MSVQTTAQRLIPAATDGVHLRDYWKIVWQGRWTVLAVFLLVVSAVAVRSFLQTPIYRAMATLEIQPQARRLAPVQDVSGLGASGYGWFAEEKYKNTQIEIIKSRDVAERAFYGLDLGLDPHFEGSTDPVAAFQKMIRVSPRRETGLIEISIEGPEPDTIARWVNGVASAYVGRNLSRARANARGAVESIQDIVKPLRSELSAAEEGAFEVLRDQEIYDPENQKSIVMQRLSTYHSQMAETEVTIGKLRSLLDKIDELQRSGADALTLPELAQDPTLQDLNRQRVALERELESAKVTYREGHRAYQEKLTQLDTLNQRIANQVELILGKIENQYELAMENLTYLQSEIRKAEETDFQVGVATSRYDLVKADTETIKQVYDIITKTMNEVSLGAELLANNVTILDRALPPRYPVKPKKKLNLLIGGIFGLFLGFGLVFFLDYLDNTLRSPEDVEKHLKLNTLAVIPAFRSGDRDERAIKEAYQSLRTALVFSSINRERRAVLITSTVPQEGKSSTVARLGRTLAGAGEKVVVIDCDLRKPTQHVHLQVSRQSGLSNYLAAPKGNAEWKAHVCNTDVPGLDVMPSGPIPPNPPDLLGTGRFRELLSLLREEYDWVLMDSPPSMSLSDPLLLASLADMVMLVVRHNDTDRDVIARNIQHLRNANGKIAGVVLNNVDIRRAYQKDYYYSGYYYYSDTSDGETSKRKKPALNAEAGSGRV